ncbi:MAG: hypothetical protein IPL59_08460 [Candidatus Competibacteraceae bacterium]|nr:hypothetical protein [Candidatus Competibacteraceae bacterium]
MTVADRQLTAEAVLAAVGDGSATASMILNCAALLGQPQRVARRVLNGLRGEDVEPVLINWVLHQEIRVLTALAFARSQRQPLEAIFAAHKVWDKRKPLLNQALQRLTLADCRQLLRTCSWIDRAIKGLKPARRGMRCWQTVCSWRVWSCCQK